MFSLRNLGSKLHHLPRVPSTLMWTVRYFRPVKPPVAMITEDHDTMPEMYREDRALGIAETTYKNDKIMNDIFNKEQSIGSLQNYYNSYYKSMSLLHNAFMMHRVNEIFKAAKYKGISDTRVETADITVLKHQANNLFR